MDGFAEFSIVPPLPGLKITLFPFPGAYTPQANTCRPTGTEERCFGIRVNDASANLIT